MNNELKFTGERCIPEHMAGRIKTYQHHLNRYSFALMYVRKKVVLDAACGCGFGTNLFYDVASFAFGVDNSQEAINYANYKYNGIFNVCDLDKDFPTRNFDIVVSFETIEHLNNPEFFIDNVKKHSNGFLFSVPIEDPNEFHKHVYTINDIQKLIEKHYNIIDWFSQRGLNITKGINNKSKYLIGYATNN